MFTYSIYTFFSKETFCKNSKVQTVKKLRTTEKQHLAGSKQSKKKNIDDNMATL